MLWCQLYWEVYNDN
uniref:Uncharacterized protein n=1 Tax=Rhizophora mucronata TaxID=61149 RepID=A0A2P2IWA8_RHIMU